MFRELSLLRISSSNSFDFCRLVLSSYSSASRQQLARSSAVCACSLMNQREQLLAKDGIFHIVHAFLNFKEEPVSLRCIAENIVIVTTKEKVVTLDATDQYKSAQLSTSTLIAQIQRACLIHESS